ncbi:bifunctional UDP-sugar hydrolase/5'-nucleotidase [Lutibacter sp. B1]|uniref:bifunctional metallophosphatase/5'-nucleotidase n=1 Tax=Lutibacter sp. B1 TaxID=2725996 RepID=UPI0014568D13|nr:metallophosphatase [Lutibacter sp. B1]NLP58207.1 bifunctional metallophosphatase/5'-nucleotidase [Lutibacter sp. B1]
MKRRNFIQKSTAVTAFLTLGGFSLQSFAEKSTKHITILHTNDVHSHIEPFPINDSRYPNQGGVARRATLVESIRKENPNTLLLDAGDIFQGTPYFNFYGGELEFKLMSMLNYDAATIGNHDFDNSIDGLYAQLPHAKFDFLSANYNFKNTVLDTHVKPYKVFVKEGIKIGVFGLGIELKGLVDPKMYKETKYLDPIEIAQDITQTLKVDEDCDLIICLSHLGYNYKQEHQKIGDLTLASKTKDIDLIIGGHTHTFLPKPTVTKNIVGENVLVNQVGCYGINLGRIDFYFDKDYNKASKGKSIIV